MRISLDSYHLDASWEGYEVGSATWTANAVRRHQRRTDGLALFGPVDLSFRHANGARIRLDTLPFDWVAAPVAEDAFGEDHEGLVVRRKVAVPAAGPVEHLGECPGEFRCLRGGDLKLDEGPKFGLSGPNIARC